MPETINSPHRAPQQRDEVAAACANLIKSFHSSWLKSGSAGVPIETGTYVVMEPSQEGRHTSTVRSASRVAPPPLVPLHVTLRGK
jgi:hypothetical protein